MALSHPSQSFAILNHINQRSMNFKPTFPQNFLVPFKRIFCVFLGESFIKASYLFSAAAYHSFPLQTLLSASGYAVSRLDIAAVSTIADTTGALDKTRDKYVIYYGTRPQDYCFSNFASRFAQTPFKKQLTECLQILASLLSSHSPFIYVPRASILTFA